MVADHDGSSALQPADFCELLQKHPGLVLIVIRLLRAPDRKQLSLSCRRCCQLVREALPTTVTLANELGLLLYNTCGQRPWRRCTKLVYSTQAVSDVLCLSAALRHAAKYWPQLQHVTLMQLCDSSSSSSSSSSTSDSPKEQGKVTPPPASLHAALMAGPFTQLQLVPQLRVLDLALPAYNALTMDLLGALVQLTRLTLKHPAAATAASAGSHSGQEVDCWPLAALVNLRRLHLYGMYPCAAPAAAAGGAAAGAAGALPPFLTQLVLAAVPRMECWVPHLCSCSRLEHLEVEYVPDQDSALMAWQGHPSVVLSTAAPHLPHLTFLVFSCVEGSVQWDRDVAAILEGADPAELPASQHGFDTPLHPVRQMSHLTALQKMSLGPNMELHCLTEDHWRHLAGLTALRSLDCMAAGCLPPPGVQLEQLTFLDGWVDDDAYGYVCCAPRVCPRLETLHLAVWEGWELPADADAHRFHHAPATSTLRTVKLTCNGDDSNTLVGLLQHITPARCLDITWPTYDCDYLPDLSCLPNLTRLVFRPTDTEEGAEEVGHAEHILGLVLGLGQLVELELHNLLLATPRLALALQHEYAHLQLLRLVNCGCLEGGGERGPSDSASLDRVMRLLRPDLRIEEVGEDEVVVGISAEVGGQQEAALAGAGADSEQQLHWS